MSEYQQVVKSGLRRVGRGLRKLLLWLIVITLLGGGAFLWVSNWTYSEGSRAGILIKLSRKGFVWKTYEGQLNLGGFDADPAEGNVGNIWAFSVRKKALYEEMQKYEGEKVRLEYRQVYNAMPWQGKTEYLVTEVERVGEE